MSKVTLTILSADPLAPDNGRISLFRKNDGVWYEIDDTGTVSALFGQASGTNLGSGVTLYAGLTGGDTLQFKSLQSTVPSLLTIAANGDGNHVDFTIEDQLSAYTNDAGFITGNQTITLSGDVTGTGTTAITTTIADEAVTLAKMAHIATDRFLGRTTAATGDVEALTTAQATAMLDEFTSALQGVVPASGGGTTNFLRADGTWDTPAGTASPLTTKGDVYTYDTADARLGVGTDGQVLTADSGETTGLKWATPAGTGDVTKVGTPVNNELAVWTGDGTLEGESDLTYDGTDLMLSANLTDLRDITFQTGATGGTVRTGTANADKFVLQAYDVDGAAYQTVLELDAGNDPVLQLRADFLEIDDETDTTKRVLWDVAGASTGTATTLDFNQTAARTITFPDATTTLLGDNVTDELQVGFSTAVHAEGTVASGTFTPDEADGSFQGYTNGGAHTLAPPTNNTTLIIKVTNNASAGAITTSGFTATEGDSFTTTNGDVFLCWITKIDGSSILSVKQIV